MDYISKPTLMGKLTCAEEQKKIKAMTGEEAYNEFLMLVNAAAKIELLPSSPPVAPVRHERWIDASVGGTPHYRCSGCGEYIESVWTANFDYRYCPNCGAYMGDADNGERKSGTRPQREDV